MAFKILLTICLFFFVNYCNGQSTLQAERVLNTFVQPGKKHLSPPPLRNDPNKPWRLPLDIKPTRYDINIIPIIDEDVPQLGDRWTAPGSVTITFSVINPTSKIIVHASEVLVIEGTTSVKQGGVAIPFLNETYDIETQFHTINFDHTLMAGTDYTLEMEFIAPIIETELNGLYRSSYNDPTTNETKLNEGMSSFIEYIGLDFVAPEFKAWDIFITDNLQRALAYDSVVEQSHSLKIDEDEWITKWAMDWFDVIVYQKGGSIARMMQGFLTEPILQEGLKAYQTAMKFQAAEQDDLFEAVATKISQSQLPGGMTLTDVMNPWTLVAGYPYLNVTEDSTNLNLIHISQTKFGDEGSSSIWPVPISVASESNPNFEAQPEYWLTTKSLSVNESSSDWIVINAGATGYYRVLYSPKLETQIQDQLVNDHTLIHHHNRGQFLDDYFNFAWYRTGENMIERALSFTKYMGSKAETEYVVFKTLLSQLTKYLNIGNIDMRDAMKGYLLPRIKLGINAIGGIDAINKSSKGIDVIRHTQLLDWACTLDDPDCLKYSVDLVRDWHVTNLTNNPVPLDLQPVVYCASAKHATEYQAMLMRYALTEGTTQNPIILKSLSCIEDDGLIQFMLLNVFTNAFLEKSHTVTFMTGLASNKKARKQLVDFVQSETAALINEFGVGSIVSIISSLSNFISTVEELNELELFIDDNNGTFPDMRSYLNRIRGNIESMTEFGIPIQQFFDMNIYKHLSFN